MAGLTGIGFPGFSIFNPITWIPCFGNWGGPEWSAGDRVKNTDAQGNPVFLTDAQKAAPAAAAGG